MKAHIVTREQFVEFFGTEPERISADSIEAVPVDTGVHLPHAIEYQVFTEGSFQGEDRPTETVRIFIEEEKK